MLSDRSGEEAHEKFTNMLASLKGENEKVNFIFCVVCKDIIVKHDTGGLTHDLYHFVFSTYYIYLCNQCLSPLML
jgi:hypothetical protein